MNLPERFNIADYFLDRHVREGRGGRVAVETEFGSWSYADLAQRSARAGGLFLGMGIEPGDRILIALPDSEEFLSAFLGAARMGAVAVPVNPTLKAAELEFHLGDCRARLAVVHRATMGEFEAALARHRQTKLLVVGEGVAREHDFEGRLGEADRIEACCPTRGEDAAFILYTSGSGGTPKGAVHRHQDMWVTSETFGREVLEIAPSDRNFSASKLFFAFGLGNSLTFPFAVGATTILCPERPRPEKIAGILARFRPTLFFAVPTLYAALSAGEMQARHFASVRRAVSAGETLPAEVFGRCRERLGLEVLDGIGSTEMLHMFISSRAGEARPGSCGRTVRGYEARVENEEGREVPAREIGNLLVSGESAFLGYWGKPVLTAQTKTGKWVRTGDKFFVDEEGCYHYCGRVDDMMKVSGMWVSPGEVENALLAHPAVEEAAVVAARDGLGFTHPAAYVVLRAGYGRGTELSEEILRFVKSRLAAFKCPRSVELLDELPKTATGKIQRFKLRGP